MLDSSLSDKELVQFLDQGFLVLELDDVPDETHNALFEEAHDAYRTSAKLSDSRRSLDLIADNIPAHMPKIRKVLESKPLNRALDGVLGSYHFRHPHCFIHQNSKLDQGFHKDSHFPWGLRAGPRSHRPNWAMLFYYPQDTTVELGATEIIPGTQYWNVDQEIDGYAYGEDRLDYKFDPTKEPDEQIAASAKRLDANIFATHIVVPKGSAVLVDFDLFHRGTRSTTDGERFLFKFWYARTTEPRPRKPINNLKSSDPRREPCVQTIGAWLTGGTAEVSTATWSETNEAERLARSYLAAVSKERWLTTDLSSLNETIRRAAMYGLSACGEFGIEPALQACSSDHWVVRKSAVFVLGEIGAYRDGVFTTLAIIVKDDTNDEVRAAAITSIGRIARKNLRTNPTMIDESIDAILPGIDLVIDIDRSKIPMNRVQQATALSVLTIVTEAIAANITNEALERLADVALDVAYRGNDRYAVGTAIEAAKRLAEAGVTKAISATLNKLSWDRWTSSPEIRPMER